MRKRSKSKKQYFFSAFSYHLPVSGIIHQKKTESHSITHNKHVSEVSFVKSMPVRYFLILIGIITLSIGYALGSKLLALLATSTFTHESFGILVLSRDSSIIHVDTNEKRTYNVVIEKGVSELSTPQRASFYLGVPINGVISCDKNISMFSNQKEMTFSTLLSILKDSTCQYSNVNKYDLAKMFIIQQFASSTKFDTIATLPDNEKVTIVDYREKIGDNFKDAKLVNEDLTIHIINASDIDGLGGQFSQFLKNSGFNVVSITSGATQQESYFKLYNEQKKYSSEYLASLLGIPLERSDNTAIADVVITIGRDYVEDVLGEKSRVEESGL